MHPRIFFEHFKIYFDNNAPINVKPAGACRQIPCPQANHSSQMQPNFPTTGLHIAIKYSKAEPKKCTMKIFPNKILQSLFINVAASPKIHVPVTAAIIRFNHNLCYTV